MKISQTGINLIKSFEGCSLKAYKCPAGVWTIGWGTTGTVDKVPIGAGMTITQAKADELLISRLSSYESAVNNYVIIKINQNQYDALVSFTYNCGAGALKNSDLLKHLNQGRMNDAANQFDLWTRGGGKVLPGLVKRRTAEKELFLKPCDGDDEEMIIKKKMKINGTIKEVEAIEKDGNYFVKLQDIKDQFIDVTYDAAAKIPVIQTKA